MKVEFRKAQNGAIIGVTEDADFIFRFNLHDGKEGVLFPREKVNYQFFMMTKVALPHEYAEFLHKLRQRSETHVESLNSEGISLSRSRQNEQRT